jgi:hypothetical protein
LLMPFAIRFVFLIFALGHDADIRMKPCSRSQIAAGRSFLTISTCGYRTLGECSNSEVAVAGPKLPKRREAGISARAFRWGMPGRMLT